MTSDQIAELESLSIRQKDIAQNLDLDAEVGNFVDDLYGDSDKAITDAE